MITLNWNMVFTVLLASMFLRENPSLQEWAGVGTKALGIIILRAQISRPQSLSRRPACPP
jgi:uncharacterized membrane protein